MQGSEDSLNAGLVPLISGGSPAIIVDSEFLPESNEFTGIALSEGDDIHSLAISSLLHFLTVLIHPGEEEDVIATESAIASNDISQDFFVGMSDMRDPVRVVAGGSDEELAHAGLAMAPETNSESGPD